MKNFKYKETTIMTNLLYEKFQFVLKTCYLYSIINKCSIVHYVMIMLTIMIFLICKMFSH
jgi:hypothetical protein